MSWRRWVWALFAWTFVGAFGELQRYLYAYTVPGAVAYHGPLRAMLSVWLWALMTPSIMWLARRFPVERGQMAQNLSLHAIFALGYSLLDTLVDWPLAQLLNLQGPPTFGGWFLAGVFLNLFSYFALTALSHAENYYRLYIERRLRASQLEKELASAKLRALEMQLRPHFLFNTLHTAAGLIRTGQHTTAINVLAGLGDLFRAVLKKSSAEIPLSEELELVKRYLGIEQIRFGERLEVIVDVEPNALNAKVPSLILQPLIENAVQHGLGEEAGSVHIDARIDGDQLRLRVTDSGGGGHHAGDGVGLANTRERLNTLYGDRQKFELVAREKGGTEARVTIPIARWEHA